MSAVSKGSAWQKKQLKNLFKAAETFPNVLDIIKNQKESLKVHRLNYGAPGPESNNLQLLWWEFPLVHWQELKDGARQKFMPPPLQHTQANAPMNKDMQNAAMDFIDKLISLNIVRTAIEGRKILTNAPMFVVDKPNQPGQWRIIVDMLKRGQNAYIAQDPVFLPRVAHILDLIY